MRLGVIIDSEAGAHIHARTAGRVGFKCGDYVEIAHDERGTQIVRCLCCAHTSGMNADYVYLDKESFRYLGGDLHDEVAVKRSEWDMDLP